MNTLQTKETAVVATFDTHQQAAQGVKERQKSGFDMKKLSIIRHRHHLLLPIAHGSAEEVGQAAILQRAHG